MSNLKDGFGLKNVLEKTRDVKKTLRRVKALKRKVEDGEYLDLVLAVLEKKETLNKGVINENLH